MSKKQTEEVLAELLAKIRFDLDYDKKRAEKWQADTALRARLNGQWVIIHEVASLLKLNMTEIRRLLSEKLIEAGGLKKPERRRKLEP